MPTKKNTWCPLIKDYCKGDFCVCHKIGGRINPSGANGFNHTKQPFCEHFQVYLPEEPAGDDTGDGHGL